MNNLEKLIEAFREFPGIGPRQARRFVYFLLTRQNGYTKELANLISSIRSEVFLCSSCFRFFQKDTSNSATCPTCRDYNRDKTSMMLVSHDVDFENIEKTHSFTGYYFILGGSVPILEKNPERKIRQKELLEVVEKRVSGGLSEIIIALNYNPEGENTLTYLKQIIRGVTEKHNIKISTLGRGLSTGTELEYSDSDTIKNALKNRQ